MQVCVYYIYMSWDQNMDQNLTEWQDKERIGNINLTGFTFI